MGPPPKFRPFAKVLPEQADWHGVFNPGVTARSQEVPMRYRAYSGPPGSTAVAPLEKDRLLYKEFDTLDDAFGWARHKVVV